MKIKITPSHIEIIEEAVRLLSEAENLLRLCAVNINEIFPSIEDLRRLQIIKNSSDMYNLEFIERMCYQMEVGVFKLNLSQMIPNSMEIGILLGLVEKIKLLLSSIENVNFESVGDNFEHSNHNKFNLLTSRDISLKGDYRILCPTLIKMVSWKQELEIGHPTMDFFNRKIFKKLCKICHYYYEWVEQKTEEQHNKLKQVFAEFMGELRFQFEIENDLILNEDHRLNLRELHIKQHQIEELFFLELTTDFIEGRILLTPSYLSLIAKRFCSHVINFDRKSYG